MKDPIVKKRKIAVKDVDQISDINRVRESLMSENGVISVKANVQKNILTIEYDLRKIKFEVLERSIKELGLKLSQKFLERCKRGMAKFMEQNEMDNLNAPLSSCCDDPRGSNRECNSR